MKVEIPNIFPNELILDAMPGIAYIFTSDGKMVAWNKVAEEITGYTKEELRMAYGGDFADEESKPKVKAALKEAVEKGHASTEYRMILKNGDRLPLFGSVNKISVQGNDYLIGLSIVISELLSARETIKQQIQEISKLNELLQAENVYLKKELEFTKSRNRIIGDSESLRYILFKIKQVAPTDAAVLIEGETGTGKELVAQAIHNESSRKNKPFIKVNCASIPDTLIESELFGHEKGAFTGAIEKRIGRFELADGGTIFLDEIGEMPLTVQPKLLHVLQQGEFERIGNSRTIKVNVRVIAATNKVLQDEIKKGQFRADLFYRLNVFPISVAPLREKKADIPLLAEHVLQHFAEKLNRSVKGISEDSMQRLINYSWPGNIRELENVIERALITSRGPVIEIEPLPKVDSPVEEIVPLVEFEKNHILKVLEKTFWKVSGLDGAAAILQMNPETLRSKMRKLGIKKVSRQ